MEIFMLITLGAMGYYFVKSTDRPKPKAFPNSYNENSLDQGPTQYLKFPNEKVNQPVATSQNTDQGPKRKATFQFSKPAPLPSSEIEGKDSEIQELKSLLSEIQLKLEGINKSNHV